MSTVHREFQEEKYRASDSATEDQVDATLEHGDIAVAYHRWQQRGCPDGCPDEDWYRAEQEIARHSSNDQNS